MTTDHSETRTFPSPTHEPGPGDPDASDPSDLVDDERGPDDEPAPDDPDTSRLADEDPGPDDERAADDDEAADDERAAAEETRTAGATEAERPAEDDTVTAELPEGEVVEAELAEPEPVTAAATVAGTAPALEEAAGTADRTDADPDVAERPAGPEALGAGVAVPTDEVDDESRDGEVSPDAPLLAGAGTYRERWTGLQASFVDTPRDAVEGVDRLVEEVGDEVARALATRREDLLARWESADTSTDELRRAFQEYRALFDRLLSV